MRTIFKLAIVLLIAHAVYQTVPPYWAYYQFNDAVNGILRHATGQSNDEVMRRVLAAATAYGVPVEREAVSVRRQSNRMFVQASWVKVVDILPMYPYQWHFDVAVSSPE